MRSLFISASLLIFVALTSLNCKKDKCLTCPPPPTFCEYPAGNRNFTWRLDTVAWWPSTLGGVWAFSDTDAWVMGNMHGPTVPGQTNYVGMHWNGRTWEAKISFIDILVQPNDVTGDDHFIVATGYLLFGGEKPAIAEFDNNTKKWTGYQFQTQGELRSVWTDGNGYFIAAGENGMVYTKDGYSASWVYQKAPTEFNFVKVTGVSKSELYFSAALSLPGGTHYAQIWKNQNHNWIKLMDNQDTTATPIQIPEAGDIVNEIAVSRCSVTDSLLLIVVGGESFEFRSMGNELNFSKVNLSSKGLPLSSLHKAGVYVTLFSPNDYWISSGWYYLYHWNGLNFQKIEPISSLPYGQPWGVVSRIKRNSSGKTWIVLEMDSQVYSVIQGTP